MPPIFRDSALFVTLHHISCRPFLQLCPIQSGPPGAETQQRLQKRLHETYLCGMIVCDFENAMEVAENPTERICSISGTAMEEVEHILNGNQKVSQEFIVS